MYQNVLFYFFLIFAIKNPSYNSLGHTQSVPSSLVDNNGKSLMPSNSIGTISAFTPLNACLTISSFSQAKIEHVEYTSSLPGFNTCNAFFNNINCVFDDFSTSFGEKYLNAFTSFKFKVPLPLHGASNKILSNEKYSSIFLHECYSSHMQ